MVLMVDENKKERFLEWGLEFALASVSGQTVSKRVWSYES